MDPLMMMLLAMSKSGGGDPSSAYLDPVMAYLSGSYTPERRWTDDELMSIYAPTLMRYLQQPGGEGDFYEAARLITEGQSPYEIAAQKDKLDDKPYMQLLEQLHEERSKFAQQQLSRDSRKDQFEEMGLPGYGKGYSNDQLLNMFPQVFADISPRLARSQGNTQKLAKKMESERAAFLKQLEESTGTVVPGLVPGQRLVRTPASERGYTIDNQSLVPGADLSPIGGPNWEKFDEETVDKKKKAFDIVQKARMDQQRYTSGGEGYEALRAQMQMELARQALQAQGRSPLSDALISSAMLKRVLGR